MIKNCVFLLAIVSLLMGTLSLGAQEAMESEKIELPAEAQVEPAHLQEVEGKDWFQRTEADWMVPGEPQSLNGPDKVEVSSGCSIGCYSAQQSAGLCPAGQIAEIHYTGPINACKLGNFQCKSTCTGPIVSCNGFTPYC